MIPIQYILLENFWHNNFIIFTDKHKYISAHTKIFSMVFVAFYFSARFLSLRLYLSIVWYFSRNMSLYNLSTQELSDKCSLVMSLSFTSELINGSPLKPYAASLSFPLIYFISGPYYSNIRRQHSTLSVVKFSNMRFLWSVYTVIWFHKRIVQNCFKVSTILNRSIFLVVWFLFSGVNFSD